MTVRPMFCFCCVAIMVIGCGGQPPAPRSTPTSPGPATLQVAVTYQISQTAGDDTCGMSSAPVSFNGTVSHTAGTVERDGNFTATATVGPDAGGQTYSERLEGRFTAAGFSATLRVNVSPRNCQFTRNWTAAKQGAPNVFP